MCIPLGNILTSSTYGVTSICCTVNVKLHKKFVWHELCICFQHLVLIYKYGNMLCCICSGAAWTCELITSLNTGISSLTHYEANLRQWCRVITTTTTNNSLTAPTKGKVWLASRDMSLNTPWWKAMATYKEKKYFKHGFTQNLLPSYFLRVLLACVLY